MTSKRFKLAYTDDWWAVRDGEITLWKEEVVDKLNELNEENEQLKQDKQHLHQAMSRQEVKHKKFKDKVFDLIDKSLEKDKHDYEMTYEDYLNGRIEVLEDLKKELLND